MKFIPLLAVTLLINILFFVYGYIYGRVDFTSLTADNYPTVSGFTAFFGIIIAVLIFILWLVYYTRNNSFKSFYPKSKNQLFKEWLLIFIICILNCNFYHSFEYAYKLRARHYISQEEALKRMDVISRAALFIEGSYRPVDIYETDKTLKESDIYKGYEDYEVSEIPVEETAVGVGDTLVKDSVCYYGNLYYEMSYMNKNTGKFSLQQSTEDSINEFSVKRWMYDQKKDSVKKVMDNFLSLAKEHALKANITSAKWMEIVYHPKHYTTHVEVGKDSISAIGDDTYGKGIHDSLNNYSVRTKDGYIAVPKYHIPYTQLDLAYTRISEAWYSPYDLEKIFVIVYFAVSVSLLIFSFRVTSAISWLIAAVGLAILGLITFIFSMVARHGLGFHINEGIVFTGIWLVIITILCIWFIRIYRKKQSKKLSYILVNLLLWLLPTLLPLAWFGVFGYVSYGRQSYDDYDYDSYVANDSRYAVHEWMNENFFQMFIANLVIILLYMYFFTIAIKKWKGIAEG